MTDAVQTPGSILITGASSGLGEGLALHYAKAGVFLALTGRHEERLQAVAHECRARGAQVETLQASVTEQLRMETFITQMDEQHPFDLAIANAGISGGTGGSPGGESLPQARAIFDTNVYGVFNTIEPILPHMIARGAGQIAIISSLAGFRGMPGAPSYSASKGAVRFYGEALRGALVGTGVKVNVVCPGFVKTRMTAANDFPMPFLMDCDHAVKIIADGLAANRGRIAFPLPTHFISWLISILPDFLAQGLLKCLPAKPAGR